MHGFTDTFVSNSTEVRELPTFDPLPDNVECSSIEA
jgi:hypothetical protein